MKMNRRRISLTNTRSLLLAAAATLTAANTAYAQADPHCPVQPATFKAMRNCFRPLLVFAPDPRDKAFAAQQKMLDEYADEMMDRNLLYVPVLAQSSHFSQPLDAPYVVLKQSEINALRDRFKVDPSQFLVVLVGKDGGEKFRTAKPISVLRLDALVDAMPMGQQEKSSRGAKSR
jgi:Domain of unknown function (DUF4174)